ncbi:MAG TPA: DUF6152 family protein [Bryobacteraceae bacterium]|nr:DUF6152 family protein [Bryobacteraceae bacterium]
MRHSLVLLLAAAGLLFVPTFARAHHAWGVQFDTTKTITLTGAVKNIDWRNPHVRLYLDVKTTTNDVIWEVDMGSPGMQIMNGWKIDTFRNGDRVKVDAYPARDGSNVVYGKRVTALTR